MMPAPGVRFDELTICGDGRIGVARLDAPRSLNALSLEVIHLLESRLDAWALDPQILAVWLEGGGDKAFCAGGDVVALHDSLVEEDKAAVYPRQGGFAATYFAAEYRLDYRIHRYAKPILVWGDGIVMGGGLGLMVGASHRLVTETSRIAMPEITIGLFPDIGATWFLNRMPPGIGAYLGLTGAQLNGRDALDLGLADAFVPRGNRDSLLAALTEADVGSHSARDVRLAIQRTMDDVEDRSGAPAPQVWPHLDHLQHLVGRVDPILAVERILEDGSDDAWLTANRARLAAGCPMSAHLVLRMLERHRHVGLAEALRNELSLSVQCGLLGDVREGVRALLIDKDRAPRWQHESVAAVPEADIQALMSPLWSKEANPLRDLGADNRPG
ncbi:enoyl-CoA hydratase/isomerase family protein [Halomonas sp.]|uniref:enoyl-CoA hydratase/isomerase family protein n=1 Tax=Halomonas sp. TaxID=1486246 RepID=UPI0035655008